MRVEIGRSRGQIGTGGWKARCYFRRETMKKPATDAGKRHPGQPTRFRTEFTKQAVKLVRLGAKDIELADFFGVNISTLYRWKNTHKGFCDALKLSKEQTDARVERSLFERATGYERNAVKIFLNKDSKVIEAPFREFVPPDTTACIFWLKNRQPKRWREHVAGESKQNPLHVAVEDVRNELIAALDRRADQRTPKA